MDKKYTNFVMSDNCKHISCITEKLKSERILKNKAYHSRVSKTTVTTWLIYPEICKDCCACSADRGCYSAEQEAETQLAKLLTR